MTPIHHPLCLQVFTMKVLSGSNRMLSNGKLFTMLIDVSCLKDWLAALDDFRNWLIREAA